MNFKLDEIDIGEDDIEPSDENTDDDEFSESQFDDDIDEKEKAPPVYIPPELQEVDDEDEMEQDSTPLVTKPRVEIAPFNEQEENNTAYSDAVTAYYEEKNYTQAIEKFSQAIKNEKRRAKDKQIDANEIIAKSIYWQAEAYVKTQDIPKAIKTFESLIITCKEHYLTISAQRRADTLKAKHT